MNISQKHLINQINLWLKQQGWESRLNKTGACLDFTALWIEFAQMNQLDVLKNWYSQISNWNPNENNNTVNVNNNNYMSAILNTENVEDVNQAFMNVLSHLDALNKKGNLVDSIQPNRIEKKNFHSTKSNTLQFLKSEMCTSFIFDAIQLKTFLEKLINYAQGKKLLVNYPDHATTLYYENNKYVIYNPSEENSEMKFDSLDDVIVYYIQALQCKVDAIGLAIHVVDFENAPHKTNTQLGGLTLLRTYFDDQEIVESLQKKSADTTALMIAAQNGDLKSLYDILQYSSYFNVNELSEDGLTALSLACENGHLACMDWLIKSGADPTMSLSGDRSILYIAAENNHIDVVGYLLGLNVIDIEMLTEDNTTALHTAVTENFTDVALLLLAHGADPTVIADDDNDATLLYWACYNNNIDIVKALIEDPRTDINAQLTDLTTSLHVACNNGNHEIVKYLISKNADVNLADKNGLTSLHIACEKGDFMLVKILLANGANIHAQLYDTDEEPWDIADRFDHDDIKTLLEMQAKQKSSRSSYPPKLWQPLNANANINPSMTTMEIEPSTKQQRR